MGGTSSPGEAPPKTAETELEHARESKFAHPSSGLDNRLAGEPVVHRHRLSGVVGSWFSSEPYTSAVARYSREARALMCRCSFFLQRFDIFVQVTDAQLHFGGVPLA